MARPLRIEYPGALYHVTSRGDRQEAIFDDDQDRTAFLNVLSDVVSQFRWRCHAYCLMGNHHGVPSFMREVGGDIPIIDSMPRRSSARVAPLGLPPYARGYALSELSLFGQTPLFPYTAALE